MSSGATTYDAERQRMDALAAANETRFERAKMKRNLKAGRIRISTIIMNPPWYAESMYVIDLIMALPKFGRARAQRRMNHADLPATKLLGTLTERQRHLLVAVMDI